MALLTVGAGNAWASNPGGVAAGTVTNPKAKHSTNTPAAPIVPPGAAPITSQVLATSPTTARCTNATPPARWCPTWRPARADGGNRGHRRQRRPRCERPPSPSCSCRARVPATSKGWPPRRCRPRRRSRRSCGPPTRSSACPTSTAAGHNASFISPGYDCSGTVSFALHGADLLADARGLLGIHELGLRRPGTVGDDLLQPRTRLHDVAGLRLDTSAADDPSNQQGPRWRPLRHANASYTVRHPLGL